MEGNLAENYYDILNIRKDATTEEVKKAYRKMVLQYHPDKNKCAGAEEKFKLVHQANQVLSDPIQRRIYDESRRGGRWSEFEEDPRKTFHDFFPEHCRSFEGKRCVHR